VPKGKFGSVEGQILMCVEVLRDGDAAGVYGCVRVTERASGELPVAAP